MLLSLPLLALVALAQAKPAAMPQAVTAVITPSAPAPPGCTPSASGSFGIAVQNVSTSGTMVKRQVTQLPDGQPQIQTMAPVSVPADGQVHAGMHTMMMMAAQIGDGQVQIQTTTYAPVTIIADGQPQAPTLPTPTTTTEAPVSQIGDAQPQATASGPATSEMSSAEDSPSTSTGITMVACASEDTLTLTLAGGVLTDSKGRTGYIASNYQFQFDAPPQAGAIYTAGFSACSNGTLALGGSNVFYQCLSGDFFNLYDRSWAPQCSPITINILQLEDCA
ncbi:MAG: hypothetical protein Q9222_006762 [Ikaeria aurantiellina]